MGDGTFVEAATAYGLDSLRDGRGLAVSDFDGDGGLDFVINNYVAPAHYYVNRVPNRGHWLRVRLRGRASNRDGIGAIIRVRTGDRRQMRVVSAGDGYASQTSRVAHFGLGDAQVIDELEVTWPDGRRTRQTFRDVAADRLIEIDEGRQELRVIRGARR
jgi:enediyne biosynthesis protein E4